jgi:PAS domain S-box-containing protein
LRVLIVDDHDLLRRGIRSLLTTAKGLEVCGEAVDGRDAIEKAQQLKPDVITMDVTMPNVNGLEAAREIRRLLPDTRILILSQHNSSETMRQALRAGACGYVVKSAISSELLTALEKVRLGGTYFDDSLFAKSSAHIDTEEILQLVTSTMSVAVTRCTRDLRYLWANQSYSDWIHRPLREIIGYSIQEVIGPDAFASLAGYFYRVLSGEKVIFEQRVDYHTIGPRWISCIYSPTLDAAGTPDGWVSVILDITAHKQTEQALRQSEARLKTEASALSKLNDLSSRLWSARTLTTGLQEMLDAAIELVGADKGNVLLLDSHQRVLTIAAQRGFTHEFLDAFRAVSVEHDSACGRALRARERVVIEDVEADRAYAALLDIARVAGYRAVVATPMFGAAGDAIGMLSTHFREPQCPSEESLRRLDLYARQAADFIQRCNTETVLRQSQAELQDMKTELEQKVQQRTQQASRAAEQLRELSARLLQAQDEERRRIARELHDGVGQLLTAIGMNISAVLKEKSKLSPAAAKSVEENAAMVQQVTAEVRSMSQLLHPPLLDEVGLKSALEAYVKGFAKRSKIRTKLELPTQWERLPLEPELCLFRIAQESLVNIHRHSGSATAAVRLTRAAGEIALEISDEGRGIGAELQEKLLAGQNTSVGLCGMRERVRQLGGSLEIQSSGKGTSIRAVLPVPRSKQAKRERRASPPPATLRSPSPPSSC